VGRERPFLEAPPLTVYAIRKITLATLIKSEIDMDFSKILICHVELCPENRYETLHAFHQFSDLLIHIHANSPTTENGITVLRQVEKKN